MDYRDRKFCKELIVRGEPPEILKPREGTLYNPSLVCRAKLVRVVVGSEYYFELPPKSFAYLFAQFTAVAAVGDDLFQFRLFAPHLRYHAHCALTVMHVGGMHVDGQRKAERVNHNVLLPPLDFLVAVNAFAGRVRVVRRADGTGVYDAQAGVLSPPGKPPDYSDQIIRKLLQDPLEASICGSSNRRSARVRNDRAAGAIGIRL